MIDVALSVVGSEGYESYDDDEEEEEGLEEEEDDDDASTEQGVRNLAQHAPTNHRL